jgi:hypothetical protein
MGKSDPASDSERQRLYDSGYCDDEIADKTGKTKTTISQWRNRNGLPPVFQNRKRLTQKEMELIQEYLYREKKFRRITNKETILKYEKGLIEFVMSLKHPLSNVSQSDIENYISLIMQ